MKYLTEEFFKKFGNQEIILPREIMVIRDDYAGPFSSGSNGYISKLRINPSTKELEYYLNWWAYGWNKATDGKYPDAIREALAMVLDDNDDLYKKLDKLINKYPQYSNKYLAQRLRMYADKLAKK